MDLAGEPLWNPWLAWTVLGAASLLTLGTKLGQVRALAPAFAALIEGGPTRASFLLALAGSAGMGSIAGAALAVALGGAGALVWMWIATALGMAITHAEAVLAASRARPGVQVPARIPGGKLLTPLVSLGTLAVALAVGGAFQAHEGAVLVQRAATMERPAAAVLVAVLALPFAFSSTARGLMVRHAVPLAIFAYVIAAASLVFDDGLLLQLAIGDAFNQAFGVTPAAGGATGGAIAVAVHHGVLRAVMSGEIGLGSASWATRAEPGSRGAAALLVPLITNGVVATLTALAVMVASDTDEPVTDGKLVPLERHESRGLRPSAQVGQTIVLPEDTVLESGKHYAMRLRSNPRGHAWARLLEDDNAVILPAWGISENVDTVVFRAREKHLAEQAFWDVRVPMKRAESPGPGMVKLVPEESGVELARVIAHYELSKQPYVVFPDFSFTGRVGKAMSPDPDLGEHIAMYEPETPDRPFNPKLHEFFRAGFRGPYPDEDGPRPPWGFVAAETFDAPIGSIVSLRMAADPRGIAAIRINRVGGAEGPPWTLLARTDALVLRHELDASKDIVVPVRAKLDLFRIRFESLDPAWKDFRKLEKMPEYSGPFARVSDHEFLAEVHGDARLSSELAGRRTLIPRDPLGEPQGPHGTLPYVPHPAELAAVGMTGPFPVRQGMELVAHRFAQGLPGWGLLVLVVSGLVFAVGTIAVWSEYADRAARSLLGDWAGTPGRVAVVGAAACGGLLGLPALLGWTDLSIGLALLPALVVLLAQLGPIRARLRDAGSTTEADEHTTSQK